MQMPRSDSLKRAAQILADWTFGVPVIRLAETFFANQEPAEEKKTAPRCQSYSLENERADDGLYSTTQCRNFLSFAARHIGHSSASRASSWINDERLTRLKNYVQAVLSVPNPTIEAGYDAIYLLHIMKFLGDFDSQAAEFIARAIKNKLPILIPIAAERIYDLRIRDNGNIDDLRAEAKETGERFKRAQDSHGFLHNALFHAAAIHIASGDLDNAEKELDHADGVLLKGLNSNPVFALGRPPMDTVEDKIANCMRLRSVMLAHKEAYKGSGNFHDARKPGLVALSIHKSIGQTHGVANDMRDLGRICRLEGDFDSAATYNARAHHGYRVVGDHYWADEGSDKTRLGFPRGYSAFGR